MSGNKDAGHVPAGWYPTPDGLHEAYWTGDAWIEGSKRPVPPDPVTTVAPPDVTEVEPSLTAPCHACGMTVEVNAVERLFRHVGCRKGGDVVPSLNPNYRAPLMRRDPVATPTSTAVKGRIVRSKWSRRKRIWVGVGSAAAVVLLVGAGLLWTFARVPVLTPSMSPTIKQYDRVWVERVNGTHFSYAPKRFDIVQFKTPSTWTAQGAVIKRVIGLPGDTVVCCDKTTGELEINGVITDESGYLAPRAGDPDLSELAYACDGPEGNGNSPDACTTGWSATVPAGMLFVMGDNRGNAADSAFYLPDPTAFVPISSVIGVVQ